MYNAIKVAVVLWAWGCWAWVIFSHEWLWLVASLVPYLAFNQFGHKLDKSEE